MARTNVFCRSSLAAAIATNPINFGSVFLR
jgi:hypothetical protein